MAVLKVIELLAESPEGWEAAAQAAVSEAAKTVRGIRSVYVKEQMAVVKGDQITTYRVNVLITFMVES
jgi:flavin-binding protein dodecin